jgi:hypothetical protein
MRILITPDPATRQCWRQPMIQNQFGFVMNPSHRAPRLDDAKPEGNVRHVKLARGGCLVSGSLRFTRGAIVRMKVSEESFPHGRGQIRIETEDPVGFAGPFDDASPQILLDAAGMGDPLSARQMVRTPSSCGADLPFEAFYFIPLNPLFHLSMNGVPHRP